MIIQPMARQALESIQCSTSGHLASKRKYYAMPIGGSDAEMTTILKREFDVAFRGI